MKPILSFILAGLILSACGASPPQKSANDPSTKKFETTPVFLESLQRLDGVERSKCTEELLSQIGIQILATGSMGIADVLDSALAIEINDTCHIKRK